MIKYVTVAKEGSAELVIEKSRFIAHIKSVDTRDEASEYLAEMRAKYKDATHNVPVFVIGDKQQLQWASDDGEPAGTSGAPMLQLLVKEGLTNLVLVVTRYFGGIKLGTGGLVRAYSACARAALEDAGRYEVRDFVEMKIKIPYSGLARIQKKAGEMNFEIADTVFEDEITMTLRFESEYENELRTMLDDLFQKKMKFL